MGITCCAWRPSATPLGRSRWMDGRGSSARSGLRHGALALTTCEVEFRPFLRPTSPTLVGWLLPLVGGFPLRLRALRRGPPNNAARLRANILSSSTAHLSSAIAEHRFARRCLATVNESQAHRPPELPVLDKDASAPSSSFASLGCVLVEREVLLHHARRWRLRC